ncbi:MAG: hypothetical protein FJ220_05480 [Kiritimatiellaceae bacterium]|nr:hypothetical protein [Kiritimatiellaceae bacterium]
MKKLMNILSGVSTAFCCSFFFISIFSCRTIDQNNSTPPPVENPGLNPHVQYYQGRLSVVIDPLHVNTAPVTGIYSMEYLRAGVEKMSQERNNSSVEVSGRKMYFEIPSIDPTFPTDVSFKEMLEMYEEGDLILYYSQAMSRGWVLWRNGRVLKVWPASLNSW